ncbi:MAG: sugar phosphate isomerase/epimerase family protein [Myxococcota bacterium]
MAIQFGMNLLLWTDDPTRESLLPLYERLGAMGFDGVELPLLAGDPAALPALGRRLDDMGLARTAIQVCPPEANPASQDPAIQQAATDFLKRAVDATASAGASVLGGPLYAAIGEFSGAPATPAEWNASVSVMQQVADHAAGAGVSLSFEFLNRFEIYLLNCTADTERYVRAIGRDNVGVHYDTFHAHIEEKDPAAAIRAAGSAIRHVHISENDRSTPGQGQVRWRETFDALARVGYDGWLTVEAFGGAIPELVAATKIWRPMFESEEQLARDALAFMKREWASRTSD